MRAWIGIGMAVAALAGPAVAVAAPEPDPETINGSGTVESTQYSLSVSGGPYGEAPSGSLHLNGFYSFDATATCMNVSGQDGVAGFQIDNGPYAGDGFLVASQSQETDPNPEAPTSPATIMWSGVIADPPLECPPPDAPPPYFLFSGGGGDVVGTLTHAGGPAQPLPMEERAFVTPTSSAGPAALAQARDGSLWLGEADANRIATLPDDESGDIREYPVPTRSAGISSVSPDLGGSGMWFAEQNADRIGHVSPSGVIAEHSVPADPASVGGDSAGGAWFTEPGADRIGRISASGRVTQFRLPTSAAEPTGITSDWGDTGPAGDGVWFTEQAADQIGYVDAQGDIGEYPLPTPGMQPTAIVADEHPDAPAGAWFIESAGNAIGHIDASGKVTEYPLPGTASGARGLAIGPGPDGSQGGVWFSESDAGRLGFVSSVGKITEFTLPGAHPDQIALADPLNAPAQSGYPSSLAVWWTDASNSSVGLARFPLPVAVGEMVASSSPLPAGRISVSLARRVRVRHAAVPLTIRCTGHGSCQGRVLLRQRATKARGALLGSTRFAVAGRWQRRLALSLSRRSGRLLRAARHRGLSASLTIQSQSKGAIQRRAVTLSP